MHAGHVVMRYLAGTFAKDVRRYRLFEKALDALATSPYARAVNRWVLAGALRLQSRRAAGCRRCSSPACEGSTSHCVPLSQASWCPPMREQPTQAAERAGLGNGARIATVVATRSRGSIVGLALLSYPLLQPLPPAKTSKASKADPTLTCPTSVRPCVGGRMLAPHCSCPHAPRCARRRGPC